jgi:hypothetical protein
MGALLTIFLTLGPVAAAQVTLPPTAEQERAAMAQQIETELAALPKVKADSVDQIVRFEIEHNMLATRSDLPLRPDTPTHVIAPAVRGYVRVTLLGPQDDAEARGRNFSYLQHDLTDPHAFEITTVSSVGGQMIVARDGENEHGHWSVQLVQDAPPLPGNLPEHDSVRLLVHRDAMDNRREVDLKLSAPTFVQLRSQHAAALDAYLRPILHDFKQEGALFGVSPHVAWQVLGNQFQPDPKLLAQVRQLVNRLDADNFRDRQDAAQQLRRLGQPAVLAIGKLDRGALSLSQNSAIDAFMAEFAPLPAEQIAALTQDRQFLLDVLFSDDPALRALALKQLSRITGEPVALQPDLDASARGEAITALRRKLVPATQPSAMDR